MSAYFNDYSYLFGGSTSSASQMGSMSWLSDYNSIKNGTYGKLVKAYYAKQKSEGTSSDDSRTNGFSDNAAKVSGKIQSSADSLAAAADKLTSRGTDLFKEKDITKTAEDGTETTVKGYDMDSIYSAVKQFADSYNSLVTSGAKSDSNTILGQTLRLTTQTLNYAKQLSKVGVTVGMDNKLTVDEEKFKAADISSIKSLFNGNTSFAASTAVKASMIGSSAEAEANLKKNYTSSGTYDNTYSAGNIMNSFF